MGFGADERFSFRNVLYTLRANTCGAGKTGRPGNVGGRRLGAGAIRFNARSPLLQSSTGLPAGRVWRENQMHPVAGLFRDWPEFLGQ